MAAMPEKRNSMQTLITRTSLQNRAVLEARQRQVEVKALVVKRDNLQAEFDIIFANDIDNLTKEMVEKAESLMIQIAQLNKTIGVKGSIRKKL
jgi:hypothetical protein